VNLVLIGPPGSGKGTQAGRLAKRYRIPHISTGDILRQAVRDGTPLGRQVDGIMARGTLVDDALMAGLVRERLARPDAADGFILDGFPRTVAQARMLDDFVQGRPLFIALIDVPNEAIVQRLSSRRVCESCGMTQSVSDGEGEEDSCPYCGGALIRRGDDDPATVRRRLATYASYAEPVVAYYRARPGFIAVDGLRAPDQVTAALGRAIDERRAASNG
jgi:adenylate kinase